MGGVVWSLSRYPVFCCLLSNARLSGLIGIRVYLVELWNSVCLIMKVYAKVVCVFLYSSHLAY